MTKRVVLKVGDIFEIPLPDGRFSYCQYVARNDSHGFVIQVFSPIFAALLQSYECLDANELLFPPVFVGLQATARSGRWKRVLNRPVSHFRLPLFRQTMATKPGTYEDWTVWDGWTTRRVGKLPDEMRSLELKQVWGDEGLEERIMHGTYRGNLMY